MGLVTFPKLPGVSDDVAAAFYWDPVTRIITARGKLIAEQGMARPVVTALPASPSDGDSVLLRAGVTPFEFVGLVYDGTLGKWVSPVVGQATQNQASFTETGTTYGPQNETAMSRLTLLGGKALRDAGLRLQVRVAGLLSNSGANVTSARAGLYEVAVNDPVATFVATAGEISEGASAGVVEYEDSGWVQLDAALTDAHLQVLLETKVTAGTGTFNQMVIAARWVSA